MKRIAELDLAYYAFEVFEASEMVNHGFSTRLGGVSGGCFYSLNLGFSRGDDFDNVNTNYDIFCEALGINKENLVFSAQTHTTNIAKVTKRHRGNGIIRKNEFSDIDGLVTNEPETPLVTFYADCAPIFFLDPVKRAIGLSHAGWRGSLNKIAAKTVETLTREYGTNPSDILAGIGPSIGQCCFETGADVYPLFEEEFAQFSRPAENGGKCIDLWGINRQILGEAGVKPENIEVAGICTKCRADEFFSHRKQGGQRGSLAAIMELRR